MPADKLSDRGPWPVARGTPTRTVHYFGGPLDGQSMDVPVETRFTTAGTGTGVITYTACHDDPNTFTPGGISVAETQARMRKEDLN